LFLISATLNLQKTTRDDLRTALLCRGWLLEAVLRL
jgi:hypothetical protein